MESGRTFAAGRTGPGHSRRHRGSIPRRGRRLPANGVAPRRHRRTGGRTAGRCGAALDVPAGNRGAAGGPLHPMHSLSSSLATVRTAGSERLLRAQLQADPGIRRLGHPMRLERTRLQRQRARGGPARPPERQENPHRLAAVPRARDGNPVDPLRRNVTRNQRSHRVLSSADPAPSHLPQDSRRRA